MSKRPFNYQFSEQGRMLRIALAIASKGETDLLGKCLLAGGRISDWEDLGHALTKRKRGRPGDTDAAKAADHVLACESRWRRTHPGQRLPYGYRVKQIFQRAKAAWIQEGFWEQPDIKRRKLKERWDMLRKPDKELPKNILEAKREYLDLVTGQILTALENKRKNKARSRA